MSLGAFVREAFMVWCMYGKCGEGLAWVVDDATVLSGCTHVRDWIHRWLDDWGSDAVG